MATLALSAVRERCTAASLLRSDEGSTTLEFAVAMPVMLVLLFGSMVALLGLFAFGNATFAAGAGARYASLHGSNSDTPASADLIAQKVRANIWVEGQAAQVDTVWSAGNAPGSVVTVTTTLTIPIGIPFTGLRQIAISTSAARVVTH